MNNNRRSDKYHDIGDPKPGEIGDKRPSEAPGNTPMERIHNRRHGTLEVPEPSSDNQNTSSVEDQKTEDDDKHVEDEGLDFADPNWEDHFEDYHLPD